MFLFQLAVFFALMAAAFALYGHEEHYVNTFNLS